MSERKHSVELDDEEIHSLIDYHTAIMRQDAIRHRLEDAKARNERITYLEGLLA